MTRVLLLHGLPIPHYRVPIYSYLSNYLRQYDFDLIVAASAIQPDNPHPVDFEFERMRVSPLTVWRLLVRRNIGVVILFVDMGHWYLFPTYFLTKVMLRRKIIYWGQGLDLAHPRSPKTAAYWMEHSLADALILYAEQLKRYVFRCFHKKVFIANNTLHITYPGLPEDRRRAVLEKHGIRTSKNIVCVGRLQKRKRLHHLIAAHRLMNRPDIGLILAGPDSDGVLRHVNAENIYNVGPVYGDAKFDLISAADVFCIPGAVGLSIVDAFYCGLPIVTEDGDESAELMYLKSGKNGFVVPRGDIRQLAEKLSLLLDNEDLRRSFSGEARREITENGSIDKLGSGFRDALQHVTGKRAKCPELAPNAA